MIKQIAPPIPDRTPVVEFETRDRVCIFHLRAAATWLHHDRLCCKSEAKHARGAAPRGKLYLPGFRRVIIETSLSWRSEVGISFLNRGKQGNCRGESASARFDFGAHRTHIPHFVTADFLPVSSARRSTSSAREV